MRCSLFYLASMWHRFYLVLFLAFFSYLSYCAYCNGASAVETKNLRIYFERTGGFAGIRFTTTIDTSELPPEEAEKLRKMVEEADFFNLPAKITSPSPQPDRFQYKLRVEEEGRQHTVTVSEEAMPPKLSPLVKWLMSAARKGGKGADSP
ncbi:MAG TPA: protealysin inhibitor emfourin [Candidatus Hypogeohydataceae bacterium YC41]